jgi:cleavage and polyadenylation specificity factor subunit 1
MCVKTIVLESSEITRERRSFVVVGTALISGSDLLAKGRIYVFDIIHVVPEPDRPETARKLKVIAKEEVKGAVTALSEIGNEGFLLVAQGQKCMVRGLKEDGTLLPVAFIDTQCYVTVAKELKGTNLCVFGDAVKGVWLAGYNVSAFNMLITQCTLTRLKEDPYQLRAFGKSVRDIEVITADFLPDGKQLYIAVIDGSGDLRILQFEPQSKLAVPGYYCRLLICFLDPKSLGGQRLLHLSTFHTGAFPSTMSLLPRSPTSSEVLAAQLHDTMDTDQPSHPAHQILLTAQTGAISLLTPLSTSSYRTLAALQSYLTNTLLHHAGLNPRAYRNVDADLAVGGRPIIDGNVLKRWMELGSWKRAEGLGRSGAEGEWDLRRLIDGISGAALIA